MEALPLTSDPVPPPPRHVAIIMDGNGRWAQRRGLPRIAGHRRGAEVVREAITAAIDAGVGYLTLFGFSSENWKRPETEVNDLMGLLRFYLRNRVEEMAREGVRLRIIGDRGRLGADLLELIREAETRTDGGVRLVLTIALSYGGRDEIVRAARDLAREVAAGRLVPDNIDETFMADRLFTSGMPDPDLLIRTSGEKRISNFLLWQMAYAEFVFTDTLWPDFSQQDFHDALREFRHRERRYGTTRG